MNKQTIISILLALVAMAGQAQVHYRLEGFIGDSTLTGKAVLRDMYSNDKVIADSVSITKGMITPVEGEIPDTTICGLFIEGKTQYLYPIFIGGGTTVIHGNVNTHYHVKLSGTPLCDDYSVFLRTESEVIFKYMIEQTKKPKEVGSTGYLSTADMGRELNEQIGKTAVEIFSRHSSDMLGLYLLREGSIHYLTPKTWLALFDKMEPWLKTNPKLFRSLSSLKQSFDNAENTSEGMMFVDVESEVDGRICHLSDFVGKGSYVLADFWGSMCGPCLVQIPILNDIYLKYKDRGLTVLGIAVGENAEKSRKAIEKHKIAFPQLLNTQNKATEAYGIVGAPYNILFAPDGTIVARGLSMDELKVKLEEMFNGNK